MAFLSSSLRCRAGKTGTTTMSRILLQLMGKVDFHDVNDIPVHKAMNIAKVKEENYPATRRYLVMQYVALGQHRCSTLHPILFSFLVACTPDLVTPLSLPDTPLTGSTLYLSTKSLELPEIPPDQTCKNILKGQDELSISIQPSNMFHAFPLFLVFLQFQGPL